MMGSSPGRAARPRGMEAEGGDGTPEASPGKGGGQEEQREGTPSMVTFREVSCQLIPLLALQE